MRKMGIFGRLRKEKKDKVVDPKIKRLVDDLSDNDIKVRKRAIRKLSSMGEPAVEPLVEAFRSSFMVIYGPHFALAKIGEPAVEPLVRTLKDKKSNIYMRSGAAATFSHMSQRASEPLMSVLREKAAEPLIETLTKNYCRGNKYMFAAICGALGRIGDPRAVEPLKRALEVWKYDRSTQFFARKALKEIEKQQG
ncbi:MAG: hypothetical protein OEZ21_04750 [Candidatus Bathyarchaeota archaeon]|nr:hypothetical protein [Candidatus Bathyarchaeota archaeon]MDH5746250.1 hypothetical protein [Candidatus Bathyarchaeota archaeon]